jgi:hypothetical protein
MRITPVDRRFIHEPGEATHQPTITIMKTLLTSLTAALCAIGLSSCATPVGPSTQRGAATGALGGAALGGIIGHQSGRALEGAAVGAAGGALIGGAYGNANDAQRRGY